MERDFKGVWIPKEIWLAEDLNWTEKMLLVEIDSLAQSNECFASNDYFAKFFNLKKDTISKIISTLKAKGYVEVYIQYKEGTKQVLKRIISTIPYRKKILGGVSEKNPGGIGEKSERGIGKKSEDNNTNNNNTIIINNTRTQKNEKKAPPTQKQQYISYKEKERIEQEKKADNLKKHTGAPINFEGDLNDWYYKTMDTFA